MTAQIRRMPVLEARPIGVARPLKSRASLSIADAEICRVRDRAHVGESAGFLPKQGAFQICSEATGGWTSRSRLSNTKPVHVGDKERKMIAVY